MSMTSDSQPMAPLGVGAIISESFSILFKNFISVMILAFVPTLIGLAVSVALIGFGMTTGSSSNPEDFLNFSWLNFSLSMLANIVFYSLSTALLIQLAYDAKLNRSVSIGKYIGPAMAAIVPIVVLSTVAGLAIGIASLALIIPGLWLYAVFSVVTPAIVIDRAGFGALGRSAALTKEYRWPILGALILVGICTAILSGVGTFIAGLFAAAVGEIAVIIILAALNGVAYGLAGISVALIYARLREIKDGVGVDDLAAVFE